MTYVLVYESKTGLTVDEVWFIENKTSENKNGAPQLNSFKLELDDNTRRLYEALLYEPLKRTLEAVSDPDYVYLINQSDNFTDMAELHDFWCRTQIAEIGVDDFNIEESKKELVAKRLKKIRDSSLQIISPSIIKKFKETAASFIQYDLSNTNMTHEEKIEHVLRTFGTIVKVAHKFIGYSSNTYLLDVSAGVKVSSIYGKRLDIANALDVSNVRISSELVVYEGKSYLGIDITKKREKDLFFDTKELRDFKIPLGKDNQDETIIWDLENQSTPHMLVCGATGSGKTIFLRSTVEYAIVAGVSNIIVFDPKYSKDLKFPGIPTIHDINEIEDFVKRLVDKMNELIRTGKTELTLVVFDEFADAFDNSTSKKELGNAKTLEENIKLLAQKGRQCGIRLILGTQRASVKVVRGDIKVNFPVQVCFRVPKVVDSKVVLDEEGAESLAGKGDGLIKSPEYINTIRFQAFYKP